MGMMESSNLEEWVLQATTQDNLEFRQAVHTVLAAISSDGGLQANMVMKGGILLAVRYRSSRFTRDIDLSTSQSLSDGVNADEVADALDKSLARMTVRLPYDLTCLVQSHKLQPKGSDVTHPSIKFKIGYAYKGTPKHKRLLVKKCPSVISIDYSLNELLPNIDTLRLKEGDLLVYSAVDLVAEKYRSLLQQVSRNRNRRQDVYDLFLLVEELAFDDDEKHRILESLLAKSRSRDIEPDITSIDDAEIKSRAERDYHSLQNEVEGELPDFGMAYHCISVFYHSLPWDAAA